MNWRLVTAVLALVAGACSDDAEPIFPTTTEGSQATSASETTAVSGTTIVSETTAVHETTTAPSVATTVTTLAPTTTSSVAPAPRPDLLAFPHSDFPGSFYGLYVADPDAGTVVPLLTGTTNRNIADPAWSPDATTVAFMQTSDPADPPPITNNLYIIGSDGSGLLQLTSGGNVWGFDWSPDGERLAYSLGDTDSDADIWTVDTTGGAPVRLTDLGDAVGAVEPVWSPDGTQLAFERGTRPGGFYWESDLYLVGAAGGVPSPAITVPLAAGPINHSHSWSPDGTRIAYSSSFEDGGGVVWVVNLGDGTESSISGGVGEAASPAWSPVANEVAFFGVGGGGTSIWISNADGSDLRELGADISWGSPVDWSADGVRLAYHGDDAVAAGLAIWIINRDGTGVTQITDLIGLETGPSWSR